MVEFSERIGGFPDNVCAMTTLTSADPSNLKRLADLKKVKASIRGLSVEPLWEDLPADKLDLTGIDWLILGGESGSGECTRGFNLEWVDNIRAQCEKNGVAFFLKQLGRKPYQNGEFVKLKDPHGGTWDEWAEEYRVREFPQKFHDYRKDEKVDQVGARPVYQSASEKLESIKLSDEEKERLEVLRDTVKTGMKSMLSVGAALIEIKDDKLYRETHKNFGEFCDEVLGMSRQHADRLVEAVKTKRRVDPVLKKHGLPEASAERHLREYKRLDDDQIESVVKKLSEELEDEDEKKISLKRLEKLVNEVTIVPVEAEGGDEPGPETEEPDDEEVSDVPNPEPEEVDEEDVPDDTIAIEVETSGKLRGKLNEALGMLQNGDEEAVWSLLSELVDNHRKAIA